MNNIPEELLGQRLDKILCQLFPQYSRVTLQNCIKNGQVLCNNIAILDPSKKITKSITVKLLYNNNINYNNYEIQSEDIPIDIVFEDDYIIVINKPAGLVCHPAPGHKTGTLVNALVHKFKLSNIGDNIRPGIVHRLDKDTSGLMLVAKTNEAHFAFAKLFAEHKGKLIKRKYICLVYGNPKSGELQTYIKRHPVNRQQFIAYNIDDSINNTNNINNKGKLAITLYKTLSIYYITSTKPISVVECELLTGRTHQIRVHMKYLGCPIVGDQAYGKQKSGYPEYIKLFPRQALHSSELSFEHPITKQCLTFYSHIPQDMDELLNSIINHKFS